MRFHVEETGEVSEPPQILVSGAMCAVIMIEQMGLQHYLVTDCEPMRREQLSRCL